MTSWPNMRWFLDWKRCERMISRPNLKCYVDWRECDREHSQPIWITIWIITDDIGWYFDIIWGVLWIGTNSEIMLSWPNWKWYVDLKVYDRKLSRPIWSTMWFRTYDTRWSLDLIWGALWLEQLWIYAVMTSFELLCGLEGCGRIISRPIWSNMWIRTDDIWSWYYLIFNAMWIRTGDNGWYHDLIWSDIWIESVDEWCCHDQ
jgi:hypothetical protein